jgi:hypothetical protein
MRQGAGSTSRSGRLIPRWAWRAAASSAACSARPPEEVFAAVTAEVGRLLAADITVLDRYDPQDTETVLGAWSSTGASPVRSAIGRASVGGT